MHLVLYICLLCTADHVTSLTLNEKLLTNMCSESQTMCSSYVRAAGQSWPKDRSPYASLHHQCVTRIAEAACQLKGNCTTMTYVIIANIRQSLCLPSQCQEKLATCDKGQANVAVDSKHRNCNDLNAFRQCMNGSACTDYLMDAEYYYMSQGCNCDIYRKQFSAFIVILLLNALHLMCFYCIKRRCDWFSFCFSTVLSFPRLKMRYPYVQGFRFKDLVTLGLTIPLITITGISVAEFRREITSEAGKAGATCVAHNMAVYGGTIVVLTLGSALILLDIVSVILWISRGIDIFMKPRPAESDESVDSSLPGTSGFNRGLGDFTEYEPADQVELDE